ncbi:hypothetical protein EW146_g1207 [Bondarzewia mesenterica]|uniref:AA9 family lytic polysaccharide monooxygenase n=1 Tax=Bondarzewia mesenterica TaxID=1095465 RepID=A0A4S4M4M3_9AGAM|nr:hypothetical protein EW146_g1207 [Bondarzewia mesenterica]
MKGFTILASFVLLASSASANTVFSAISVNGIYEGHAVGVRVPSANTPITDLNSDNIICNTGFIQPVSDVVVSVPAGGNVTASFHHFSAGYLGPDPADPIDPTNKGEAFIIFAILVLSMTSVGISATGPLTAYLAAVPDATQTDVTGLKWFKIWQDGLSGSRQWGSDRLFINGGNATFTIPSCVKSGQYLLRVEDIALQSATSYPGAQFYMSCAQIEITGGGSASPATVSFPGAYTPTSPGIVANIVTLTTYTPPGPAVFTC